MTEYSIIMKMTKITLCQQDDLESEIIRQEYNEDFPCHIYFICRRPRIMIVPEKCFFNKELMTLTFSIQKKLDFLEHVMTGSVHEDCSDFKLISNYPFNKFQILKHGEIVVEAKSALYYNLHLMKHNPDLDLEILYIGQSFGVDGARTSPERLKQHSTLQKIYSEAIQNNPDCEIWLNLLSFERIMLTSFDGINKYPDSNEDKDIKKVSTAMHRFVTNTLSEQQITNFTEASLIKYFKPEYNIEYKDKFPNPAHKSYSECYELDINSVAFELEADCIKTRLFTSTIPPAFVHLGSFTLETRAKRISMFDILDNSISTDTLNVKIE
jgi:hypothetical protein